MCSLVVAWRVLRDAPVAVAANRDERYDRSASPPRRIAGDPAIVAPRDDAAGGTWLGYNDRGLLVGLSNRWTADELPADRSRGRLVLDLLGAESADVAASMVEAAVEAVAYAPFNLVVADAATALVLEWDGKLGVSELSPGVHVVVNAGWDSSFAAIEDHEDDVVEQVERARRLRERLAVVGDEPAEDWLDRAATVLGDHEVGACVHGDGFGTRSASLLALAADGTASYRFADGPPCTTAFAAVDEQI